MTVWAAHAPNYDYSNVDFYEENTVLDAEGDLAANTLLDYQHEDQAAVEEEARALHHTVQQIYKKQKIFHLILLLGASPVRSVVTSELCAGIVLISVVMLLAVVSLAVSLVTRRTKVTSTAPGPGVKQVPVLLFIININPSTL